MSCSPDVPPSLADVLVDVRRATRLLHGYQRRLLDVVRVAADRLVAAHELSFLQWSTWRYAQPGGAKVDPTRGRWAWDYLPLAYCDFEYGTHKQPAPESLYCWFHHEIDTGFAPRPDKLEPRAEEFPPEARCTTQLGFGVLRIPGALPPGNVANWQALYYRCDHKPATGIRRIDLDGAPILLAEDFRIGIELLATPADVDARLVQPVLETVKEVLAAK